MVFGAWGATLPNLLPNLQTTQLKISAWSSHSEEVEIEAAACVAWNFTLKGGATFSVTSADGKLIVPAITHKDKTIRQRTWLGAGKCVHRNAACAGTLPALKCIANPHCCPSWIPPPVLGHA